MTPLGPTNSTPSVSGDSREPIPTGRSYSSHEEAPEDGPERNRRLQLAKEKNDYERLVLP